MGDLKNKTIIVDTGFFLALVYARDSAHEAAKKAATKWKKLIWLTTWPVLTEVCHLLPPPLFSHILKVGLQGLFKIFELNDQHLARIQSLYECYQDHPIDLADISLILLAENLKHGNILTCDERDFSFLRWNHSKKFTNLMFE